MPLRVSPFIGAIGASILSGSGLLLTIGMFNWTAIGVIFSCIVTAFTAAYAGGKFAQRSDDLAKGQTAIHNDLLEFKQEFQEGLIQTNKRIDEILLTKR